MCCYYKQKDGTWKDYFGFQDWKGVCIAFQNIFDSIILFKVAILVTYAGIIWNRSQICAGETGYYLIHVLKISKSEIRLLTH